MQHATKARLKGQRQGLGERYKLCEHRAVCGYGVHMQWCWELGWE